MSASTGPGSTYLRQTGGKLCGPARGRRRGPPSAERLRDVRRCGGAMHAIKRTSRRGGPASTSPATTGGSTAPAPTPSLPLPALDAAVLAVLRDDVLTPEMVEAVVTRTIELARLEPDEHAERRRLTRRPPRTAPRRDRTADRGHRGRRRQPARRSWSAIRTRERERADVLARLEHLDGLSRAPEWGDGIREQAARAPDGVARASSARQPEVARQILRKLIVGRLTLTPDPAACALHVHRPAPRTARCWRELVVRLVPPG